MKRLLICLLVTALLGISSSRADENIRALQSKLKESGFFFGEVNGTYSSDTAAAVTRYQIRNGLPISGQLDPATAKSLGLAAGNAGTTAPAAGNADTWRSLRKTDQQFLTKINAGKPASKAAKAPPAPPRAPVAASQPPAAPAANTGAAPYASTFTLSRERLRDYIAAFVLAGLDPEIGAELEFFGDSVRYYDSGAIGRDKIRRDLQTYANRWPERRFWLAGEVQIQPPQADGLLRVTFPLRYELRNGPKQKAGTVRKTLELQVRGEDLEIVGVNERKA
jgi:N-acetylmuramoyl-L-alanine amidase